MELESWVLGQPDLWGWKGGWGLSSSLANESINCAYAMKFQCTALDVEVGWSLLVGECIHVLGA